MPDPHNVPFGKYKDQPVESLLADQSYLDWIAAQPQIIEFLQSRYPQLFYQVQARTDQSSVQHNRLQAMFLDWKFARNFIETLEAKPIEQALAQSGQMYKGFECGYDVHLWWDNGPDYRIEIKPTLGDDFPAVLRQMHHSKANILLIEKFSSAACSFEQVKHMFGCSFIKVFFFSEILPCLPAAQS